MLLSVDQSQNIPPELWVNIFSHVTPKEMGVLSSVCRNFSNISCDQLLWRALAQRDYPDTYAAQLSERQIVQETEEGNKRRRVGNSSEEINWKEVCIARASFFSAAKKGELKCTTLLTPDVVRTDGRKRKHFEKDRIFCLDFFDGRPYVGVEKKLVTFDDQEKLVEITPEQDRRITSIKVEKRNDGMIYVYTGDRVGHIFSWQFNGSQFEQKKKMSKAIGKIIALEISGKTLISACENEVCFWHKKKGILLETFHYIDFRDKYTDLSVSHDLIFASTDYGIIRIWDAVTHESLSDISTENDGNAPGSVVLKIKVVDNKIFYSNHAGIFAFDLEQKSIIPIVEENLMSCDFAVFDGKIFLSRIIGNSKSQGLSIFDIKTSTFESKPFSPTYDLCTLLKVGPRGILHSGENLYLTQLSKNDNSSVIDDKNLQKTTIIEDYNSGFVMNWDAYKII